MCDLVQELPDLAAAVFYVCAGLALLIFALTIFYQVRKDQ